MWDEHICGVCHQPISSHRGQCRCGCEGHYLPALCCEGCPCRSFEDAHRDAADSSAKGTQG
jgi:hypothetical protein